MNMIKGCIFDLDGVICDTAKYHFLAWKSLADELGIPFSTQDNERLKGVSRMESLNILLSLGQTQYSDEEKAAFAKQKNDQYVKYIKVMERDEILPGVEPFLKDLRRQGYKIALGSVSKNAPIILQRLQITPLFDTVIDGNVVTRAKPDPEVFLAGARVLGIAPENCVVFEDAIAGVQAAHNAGMQCVGVGSPSTLSDADRVIPGFSGVTPDFLLSL